MDGQRNGHRRNDLPKSSEDHAVRPNNALANRRLGRPAALAHGRRKKAACSVLALDRPGELRRDLRQLGVRAADRPHAAPLANAIELGNSLVEPLPELLGPAPPGHWLQLEGRLRAASRQTRRASWNACSDSDISPPGAIRRNRPRSHCRRREGAARPVHRDRSPKGSRPGASTGSPAFAQPRSEGSGSGCRSEPRATARRVSCWDLHPGEICGPGGDTRPSWRKPVVVLARLAVDDDHRAPIPLRSGLFGIRGLERAQALRGVWPSPPTSAATCGRTAPQRPAKMRHSFVRTLRSFAPQKACSGAKVPDLRTRCNQWRRRVRRSRRTPHSRAIRQTPAAGSWPSRLASTAGLWPSAENAISRRSSARSSSGCP